MIKIIFKVFFKVVLALGAVFAAVSVLQYLEDRRASYIEIYNNDHEWESDY